MISSGIAGRDACLSASSQQGWFTTKVTPTVNPQQLHSRYASICMQQWPSSLLRVAPICQRATAAAVSALERDQPAWWDQPHPAHGQWVLNVVGDHTDLAMCKNSCSPWVMAQQDGPPVFVHIAAARPVECPASSRACLSAGMCSYIVADTAQHYVVSLTWYAGVCDIAAVSSCDCQTSARS